MKKLLVILFCAAVSLNAASSLKKQCEMIEKTALLAPSFWMQPAIS